MCACEIDKECSSGVSIRSGGLLYYYFFVLSYFSGLSVGVGWRARRVWCDVLAAFSQFLGCTVLYDTSRNATLSTPFSLFLSLSCFDESKMM